ncbi:MAG: type II toxin-antitoxin system prevent-host-death family antitoxin [Robiginitomaculum sp.]|nr:MAG: type II toxin-antitoxin system prevent-host-death family antitoxin [Robiginitomaculum sp.]
MQQWQLQEAKSRLSELIKRACTQGPQEITVRGKPTVVILSLKDFELLKEPKPSLAAFLQASPLKGVALNLEHDASLTREIEL